MAQTRYIGSSIKRIEDRPLLTGAGRFVDDLRFADTLEAAFVRSPHAHAAIRGIDVSAARALPGVHAVFTLADLMPLLSQERLPLQFRTAQLPPDITPFVLAKDEVAFVGEAVAVVIAGSRYLAEDAAALVQVDYQPLPAVSDCRAALAPGAPLAHRGRTSNVLIEFRQAYGDVADAFARAPHRASVNLKQHRGGAHSIEGRGALAAYDVNEDRLTLWSSTQLAHEVRGFLMKMLRLDENQIRVVAPDVGGGFGAKFVMYPEEVTLAAACLILRRPIKWIEDRREHFLAAVQEREQYWDLEVAFEHDGRLLGVRGRMIHDEGAYTPQGINLPYNASTGLPGPYILPAYELDVLVVETNKVATMPVRGAGYPEAAFAMERLLDRDRRRARPRPRRGAAAQSGAARADALRDAAQDPRRLGDHARQRRLPRLPAHGDRGDRLCGLPRAPAPRPHARPLSRHRHRQRRQRHRPRPVRIRDRAHRPLGPHLGLHRRDADGARHQDRARANLRRAVRGVARQRHRRGRRHRRHSVWPGRLRQPADGDRRLRGASRRRRGAREGARRSPPICWRRRRTTSSCATAASRSPACRAAGSRCAKSPKRYRACPAMRCRASSTPGSKACRTSCRARSPMAAAAHAVEVEVDIETGGVRILRYVIVNDSGRIINPMIVEGQIVGGAAHGIGNALFEWMGYDDGAQPVTTTFADYLLPSATEVPRIEVKFAEFPSPLNPLGVKGVGESGCVPAAAAIVSAVEHALAPFGVRIAEYPMTPARLFALLQSSRN